MAFLSVRNFSCIEAADIELSALTVLIGPQASGKSVLTKLANFASGILTGYALGNRIYLPMTSLSKHIAIEFIRWFPPGAWGAHRFTIGFSSGEYSIAIMRGLSRGRPSQTVRVKFSDALIEAATQVTESIRLIEAERAGVPVGTSVQSDPTSRVREDARQRLRAAVGSDYYDFSIFIPAGRSFFTSVDKAIQAFDQGLLDPLTASFGKLFLGVKEQLVNYPQFLQPNESKSNLRRDITEELFDGELKFEKSGSYVTCKDGRVLPFSILSSGQQELLPLWLLLVYYGNFGNYRQMIYIEEPEAHLFPKAQDMLALYLASRVSGSASLTSLFITTHSPYILAKFNNLLKAGSVGSRGPRLRDKVDAVVNRHAWLFPQQTRAYAIVDRHVLPILGEDGLIDAAYLDQISSHIGAEFEALLEIEGEA